MITGPPAGLVAPPGEDGLSGERTTRRGPETTGKTGDDDVGQPNVVAPWPVGGGAGGDAEAKADDAMNTAGASATARVTKARRFLMGIPFQSMGAAEDAPQEVDPASSLSIDKAFV